MFNPWNYTVFPQSSCLFPRSFPWLPKRKATTVHNVPLGQLTKNAIYRTLCFAQSCSVSSLCEDKNRKKDILSWSLHVCIHFPVSVSAPLWRILSGWELSHDAVTFPWKNHRAFSHFELVNFVVTLKYPLVRGMSVFSSLLSKFSVWLYHVCETFQAFFCTLSDFFHCLYSSASAESLH